MLENANPVIKASNLVPTREPEPENARDALLRYSDDQIEKHSRNHNSSRDPIDAMEIYDILKPLNDPEHPLSLVQLGVINIEDITVHDDIYEPNMSSVEIEIAPTIAHCSMATLIGLCVRVRLERCLPARFRVNVRMKPGSHETEEQVNKQLADKERVAAACENRQLMGVLMTMMENCST